MCFAPQRRALSRHLRFQKWSGAGVFCAFWLGNVLGATTACTFSTSQFPKVVRACGALCILTWKCASRHPPLYEPTFRPSGATHLWKNNVSRLSYLFAHLDLLSSETFSSLIFSLLLFSSLFFCSTSAFHLSILSEVWLLNFLRPFGEWLQHVTTLYIVQSINGGDLGDGGWIPQMNRNFKFWMPRLVAQPRLSSEGWTTRI